MKPNDFPLYIDVQSNHPPSITKQIPNMIAKRISNLSSNEKILQEEKAINVKALKNSVHPCDLQYLQPSKKKRKRTRNPIYYNPPFSLNVKTNIGSSFLKLVDKHFPKGSKLHKHFNRSTIKVSYSTMQNMQKQINRHNAKVLTSGMDNTNTRTCNCMTGRECPLNGLCLAYSSVVYQADVECKDTTKTYYGLTSNTFKKRWYSHNSNFENPEQAQKTTLSTYVWKCRKENLFFPKITWSIKSKANALSSGGYQCDLCLTEKLTILMANPKNTLNKRDEIMTKCRHKQKYLLSETVKKPKAKKVPPDPS